jgi:hypothetical protein
MRLHASLLLPLLLVGAVILSTHGMPSRTITSVDAVQDIKVLGYSDSRKVVRDSHGHLFIAYRKQYNEFNKTRSRIFVARSNDDGQTWEVLNANRPVDDVGDYQQRVPSIAVDASDIIHLVWYGNDAGNTGENQRQIKYIRSVDGGATWSHWRNIGEVPGYRNQTLWQEHPTVFTSGINVYVVWEGPDTIYKDHQIKFAMSTDSGQTWAAWRNISPSATMAQSRPSLVAVPESERLRLYVVSYGIDKGGGDEGGRQQIYWTTSADNGATWSAWSPAAPSPRDQRHPSLAVDRQGHLHMAWRETGPKGATQINYASYDGSAWSTPVAVGPSDNYQFFPSISVTDDNQVWVAWTETPDKSSYPKDDPQRGQIMYARKPAGGWWSAPQSLTPATPYSIYGSLQRGGPAGTLDAVWLDISQPSQFVIKQTRLGTP